MNKICNLLYKKKLMKKVIIIITLLFGIFGYSQDWKTNIEEAKETATRENKNILLVFSGSHWCAPCIIATKECGAIWCACSVNAYRWNFT